MTLIESLVCYYDSHPGAKISADNILKREDDNDMIMKIVSDSIIDNQEFLEI